MANVRVLVADDDAVTRLMIVDKLSDLGYEVIDVPDGLAAIAELQQGEFDLVITDIMMPDITGQGVLDAVRHETPDTEVIVITGYGNVEMAFDCLRAGAIDFLEKPFKLHELVATVSRALDRRRARFANRKISDKLGPASGPLGNWLREFRPLWEEFTTMKAKIDALLADLEEINPPVLDEPSANEDKMPLLTQHDKRPRARTDDVLQMLREDPQNKKIKEWLAFEYYRNGEIDQAVRCYLELLEQSPDDSMARYYLGNCHFKLGNLDLAQASWATVIELAPGSSVARKAERRMRACEDQQEAISSCS